eukprot:scaffold52748_cov60-Phaeocystis_antarctica.AAC.5
MTSYLATLLTYFRRRQGVRPSRLTSVKLLVCGCGGTYSLHDREAALHPIGCHGLVGPTARVEEKLRLICLRVDPDARRDGSVEGGPAPQDRVGPVPGHAIDAVAVPPLRAAQGMHERVEVAPRVSPQGGVFLLHMHGRVVPRTLLRRRVEDLADGLIRPRVVRRAHRPDGPVVLVQGQHRPILEDHGRGVLRPCDHEPAAGVGSWELTRVRPLDRHPLPWSTEGAGLVDDGRQAGGALLVLITKDICRPRSIQL